MDGLYKGAVDWVFSSVGQASHSLFEWVTQSIGISGIIAGIAGALLLLSLSARIARFLYTPKGMGVLAAALLVGAFLSYFMRPQAKGSTPSGDTAGNTLPGIKTVARGNDYYASKSSASQLDSERQAAEAAEALRASRQAAQASSLLVFDAPPVVAPVFPAPTIIRPILPPIIVPPKAHNQAHATAKPHPSPVDKSSRAAVTKPAPVKPRSGSSPSQAKQSLPGLLAHAQPNQTQHQAPKLSPKARALAIQADQFRELDGVMGVIGGQYFGPGGIHPMGGHPMGGVHHGGAIHPGHHR